MRMPEIYLIGELRMKNFEIFRLMENKEEGWSYVKGFIIIEDCNRKARIEDYPILMNIYEDINEFESSDNLIKVKAIVSEELSDYEEIVIERISVSLVECKEKVDTLFSVILKPDLVNLLDLLDENPFAAYHELLQFTEKKPNISNYPKESLKRLFQEI